MKEERAESWVEVLSGAVSALRSNEKLVEMVSQARHALAELRAQAEPGGPDERAGKEAPRAAGEGSAAGPAPASEAGLEQERDALASRLDALSASIGELTDLLDGGLERLETVEMQLGDPDDSVDAHVAAGVERCQSRLAAVEHRLGAMASTLRADETRRSSRGAGLCGEHALRVLLIDINSRRRCDLCVALERQGFHCSAVADVGGAGARLALIRPDAILVPVDTDPEETAALVELLAAFSSTTMPAPATLVVTPQPLGRAGASAAAEAFGSWPIVCASEGAAALAAAVVAAARPQPERAAREVDQPKPEEEVPGHVPESEPDVACDDTQHAAPGVEEPRDDTPASR